MRIEPFLQLPGIERHHQVGASPDYLAQLVDSYDLHEIIEEDILESSVQDKIDVYDTCIFLVLHFPKYNQAKNKYITNEFHFIMGKDWIVTLTKYVTSRIPTLKDAYLQKVTKADPEEHFKLSPYYILYEIIDEMYDKVLQGLRYFTRDLREIEDAVFDQHTMDKQTLEEIMLRRRNIIRLKHMLKPQEEIFHELQHDKDIQDFWGDELEVYFEDLEYKLDKIMGQIAIVAEDIDSLYDTYNALVSMKINSIITVLTIFTAILGVLTLVTGFYGMNVPLPGEQTIWTTLYIIVAMLMVAGSLLIVFKHKQRL